jgi:hypothetical protein
LKNSEISEHDPEFYSTFLDVPESFEKGNISNITYLTKKRRNEDAMYRDQGVKIKQSTHKC